MLMMMMAALFVIAPATAQEAPVIERGEEINRVLLQVNDRIFTRHDYEARKSAELNRILTAPDFSAEERQRLIAQVGPQIMKAVFDELLLLSRAEQLGVLVTEDQIDAAIDDLSKAQGLNNREQMMRALEAAGMTMDELRGTVKQEITMQQVMSKEVYGRLEVSDEELRLIYRERADEFRTPERRRLREVIVRDTGGVDAEAQAETASAILTLVRGGAVLEDAIADFRDLGLVTDVIELGWLERGDLGTELTDAAWAVETGAYTDPVPARGGLHLVHVQDVEASSLPPFSAVADTLRDQERSRRFRRELRTYMAEQADAAFVREALPPEAAGYRELGEELVLDDELAGFRDPLQVPPAAGEGDAGDGDAQATGDDGPASGR